MKRKWGILILTVLAAAAVLVIKTRTAEHRTLPTAAAAANTATDKRIVYLFHDARDQDEGCRRIYAFADRAEKELSGEVVVRRPDVDRDTALLRRYSVKVLPTILIAGPGGKEEARFEGEGESVEAALNKALEGLKTAKR